MKKLLKNSFNMALVTLIVLFSISSFASAAQPYGNTTSEIIDAPNPTGVKMEHATYNRGMFIQANLHTDNYDYLPLPPTKTGDSWKLEVYNAKTNQVIVYGSNFISKNTDGSYGLVIPNGWSLGNYRIRLFHNNTKIDEADFSIVAGDLLDLSSPTENKYADGEMEVIMSYKNGPIYLPEEEVYSYEIYNGNNELLGESVEIYSGKDGVVEAEDNSNILFTLGLDGLKPGIHTLKVLFQTTNAVSSFVIGNYDFEVIEAIETKVAPDPEPDQDSEMPEEVEDIVVTPENGDKIKLFSDIEIESKFFDSTKWAKEKQVVNGYKDGTFQPDKLLSRVEGLKIVIEAAGITLEDIGLEDSRKERFTDIDGETWSVVYMVTGYENGIFNGDGGPDAQTTTARPGDTVSAVEALKMAFETAVVGNAYILKIYSDEEIESAGVEKDAWFRHYASSAIEMKLFDFDIAKEPDKTLTRGEITEMLYRMREILGKL